MGSEMCIRDRNIQRWLPLANLGATYPFRAEFLHRCRSLLPPPPFLLSLLECHLHVTIEELVKKLRTMPLIDLFERSVCGNQVKFVSFALVCKRRIYIYQVGPSVSIGDRMSGPPAFSLGGDCIAALLEPSLSFLKAAHLSSPNLQSSLKTQREKTRRDLPVRWTSWDLFSLHTKPCVSFCTCNLRGKGMQDTTRSSMVARSKSKR